MPTDLLSNRTFAAFIAEAEARPSQRISSLITCRFLAGLFTSPGLSIGSSKAADMLPGTSYAAPLVAHLAVLLLGPAIR